MKKKVIYWFLITLLFNSSCHKNEKLDLVALSNQATLLKDGDATVQIFINHRDFFVPGLPFNTQVRVLPQSFKVSLMDSAKSNIEIELIKNNWNKTTPISFTLTNTTLGNPMVDQVIFMAGKLINEASQIGEGYILAEGKIEIKELTKARILIELEGNLTKPGTATIPENYVPIQGAIIIKRPKFTPDSSKDLILSLK
ncbi:hypothetical protein [Runella slithyformis]|uniref:DUF4382 domain-containing protein n=1 Tax=Runella slithyformis (strain ATCC 29530 / DSM 19594 / LMG 11500 / NCIMB 11436 / LSU 4) TaxID=761193 RepID=A0A7U3ZI83_RUNSL|nr:hypothetical protein [Runella slithyformis]AEI47716.1 hypothetical protein Runsl_1289 [Runella slithyformis DSM 19594]